MKRDKVVSWLLIKTTFICTICPSSNAATEISLCQGVTKVLTQKDNKLHLFIFIPTYLVLFYYFIVLNVTFSLCPYIIIVKIYH